MVDFHVADLSETTFDNFDDSVFDVSEREIPKSDTWGWSDIEQTIFSGCDIFHFHCTDIRIIGIVQSEQVVDIRDVLKSQVTCLYRRRPQVKKHRVRIGVHHIAYREFTVKSQYNQIDIVGIQNIMNVHVSEVEGGGGDLDAGVLQVHVVKLWVFKCNSRDKRIDQRVLSINSCWVGDL